MPPTGDGGPASTASPLRVDETNMNQFVSTFFQHLQNMGSCSTSGIGEKNDPTTWVSAVNDVAARHSWPDHTKKSFAEGRLRGAAEAWNRFQGSAYATWSAWSAALTSSFAPLPSAYDARFMEMRSRRQAETEDIAAYIYEKLHLLQSCNIGWTSPASRQYVVDGLHDPMHAAILSAQSFRDDLETFVRRAVLLQDTTGRRLDTHSQQEPTGSRRGWFTCGRFGHGYKNCPQVPRQAIQYQTRPLPTVEVRVDGIGMLTALVDTGAQHTALLQRHAPTSLQPWTEPPLRGLGGSATPIGALDLHLHTEAGSKFLAAVPIFQDLPADMILGADYLLSGEVQLTMDGGGVQLRSLTGSAPSPRDSQGVECLRKFAPKSEDFHCSRVFE
ncbi:hypothetical protein HPB50_025945 [Hyalomma asiaticum]|uniref:Uncharacterized protein n=1 Tax=Hyalomma asiaticum TaxID=266040 RepID=A0ACB7S5R2_HYAAI|nr:hypothetical protein HPB50_025945 [Hyalomma asiaticum]